MKKTLMILLLISVLGIRASGQDLLWRLAGSYAFLASVEDPGQGVLLTEQYQLSAFLRKNQYKWRFFTDGIYNSITAQRWQSNSILAAQLGFYTQVPRFKLGLNYTYRDSAKFNFAISHLLMRDTLGPKLPPDYYLFQPSPESLHQEQTKIQLNVSPTPKHSFALAWHHSKAVDYSWYFDGDWYYEGTLRRKQLGQATDQWWFSSWQYNPRPFLYLTVASQAQGQIQLDLKTSPAFIRQKQGSLLLSVGYNPAEEQLQLAYGFKLEPLPRLSFSFLSQPNAGEHSFSLAFRGRHIIGLAQQSSPKETTTVLGYTYRATANFNIDAAADWQHDFSKFTLGGFYAF